MLSTLNERLETQRNELTCWEVTSWNDNINYWPVRDSAFAVRISGLSAVDVLQSSTATSLVFIASVCLSNLQSQSLRCKGSESKHERAP